MAEIQENGKTFKWGNNEYLIDDLLKVHAAQENNYYNFARDRGLYDDNALANLRQAITNRINAVKSGEAFGADGTLASDLVDNISILTLKKGLFKKDKYVDLDNTEWAKYYLNKLVGQLKPYQAKPTTTEDKSTWDIKKYGLEAYLTGQGLSAKDVFENMDGKMSDDPNETRSFTLRHSNLRTHLTGYRDWLSKKGFDFTKNDNEWDDDFMTTLDNLINRTDWNDSSQLTASLKKLGAGDLYTTAFTSNRWDLSKSLELLNKEALERKEKEEKEQEAKYLKEWEDYAFSKKRNITPGYYRPFNYKDPSFNGKYKNFISWYKDLNEKEQANYGTYLGDNNQAWTNAWNALTTSFRNGTRYEDKNGKILLLGTFEDQPHQFMDLGDGNYLITNSISADGQGVIYNPTNGYTSTVFLGDLAPNNETIRNEYRRLGYDYINKKYGTNYSTRSYVFEEGGALIPKHQYGSLVQFNWEAGEDASKTKAEEKGISEKTLRAKELYMDSDNKSIANPNAGWNAKHIARLGAAISDLGAAGLSFAPGGGTVGSAILGVGSTVTNFVTDAFDDAVTSGEMWKNLGLNLGMDALGLIPGGGAATKMGKIIKTLKGTVPLIIALPGVASMLANSPEIAESWKKAFDGDSADGGSKLEYLDYMNILQVLNVAAGSVNIGRNLYKSSKNSVTHSDKIAVDVTVKDTNGQPTGQRKALVLEGEDAVKFKEANALGKALEFLNLIEGTDAYVINEVTKSNKGKFWRRDLNGDLTGQNPFGRTGTGRARILEIKFDNRKGKYYAETGKWDADLIDADLVDMSNRTRLDKWKLQKQTDLNQQFADWRQKAEYYQKRTDVYKNAKNAAETKIADNTKMKADIDKLLADLLNIINQQNAEITRIQDWINSGGVQNSKATIDNARAAIDLLELSKAGKTKQEIKEINNKIKLQKSIIKNALKDIANNTPKAVQIALDKVNAATSEQTKLLQETARLQDLLDRLNKSKIKFNTRISTHSNEFNAIKDFKPIKHKFNGIEYEFDVTPDLKALDGLFKQGGSINRNKINKFLNYGKR